MSPPGYTALCRGPHVASIYRLGDRGLGGPRDRFFFLWRRKKNIYSCQKSDLLFNAQQLTKFADPSLPLNVNFCTVELEAGRIQPHHHYMSVMDLGHLLTRSGLTYLEVCSEVCHDSFCQLGNSVSLSWVVCREAFCLNVVSSSSCIPVFCLEPMLFLILC